MLKPAALVEGDILGIVSPSAPAAGYCPRRFERSLANLTALGFTVLVGEHATARHGHTAGTIEERVVDLHRMFRDDHIKGVIATVGGLNSNQLLDELDYDLLKRHPKILMGYSDITALLLAVHTMTGLVTFMGPALLPQFGEVGGLHPYARKWLRRVLMSDKAPLTLEPSRLTIYEELRWDVDDTRPRREERHPGPRIVRPGLAEGPIIAGNLSTLLILAGTPYLPSLQGAILCIEEDETEAPDVIDRYLIQLRQMGVLAEIAALLVGRFNPAVGFGEGRLLDEVLLAATRGLDVPIAVDFDFGHTDPMFILPNGVLARADFSRRAPRLQLLESAVRVDRPAAAIV